VYDWLFEGHTAVYIVLGSVAFVCLLCWKQVPRRAYLIGFGVAAALMLVYFLLDRLVETDREQIQRKIEVMAGAVRRQDVGAIIAHISEDFRVGGVNREGFRQYAESRIRSHWVDEIIVWDFQFPDDFKARAPVAGRDTEVAQVSFLVRAVGSFGNAVERCQADFVRDRDGQWRLLDFQLRNPVDNSPVAVPGLQ
jgi:ketosteroid isomerase-like protein